MATHILKLDFPMAHVKEPIFYHLVKDYDLTPNVRRARIEANVGGMLEIDLVGSEDGLEKGRRFLDGLGITVTEIFEEDKA